MPHVERHTAERAGPAARSTRPGPSRAAAAPSAHMLTTLQQGAGNAAVCRWLESAVVQRQDAVSSRPSVSTAGPVIDPSLLRPVDLRALGGQALRDRHDAALATLSQFRQCPADRRHPYWSVATAATDAGTELARRRSLATGRTFTDADIAKARQVFEANAAKPKGGGRKECIVILNWVLKDLWGDPAQKQTNETIEKAMELYRSAGRAGPAREIWFTDRKGRRTRGGARPEGLQGPVWRAALDMVAGDPGWSMFGLSLMDGFHALTLTVDNNDPAAPKVFLSDQVSGWTDGWKEFSAAALDTHVLEMVQGWWDGMPPGGKHKTVVRLWRLSRQPTPARAAP